MLFAAVFAAVPASAAVVDPVGYAVTYCNLRSRGYGNQDAIQRSINQHIDFSKDATVLSDGTDLDIRLGYHGVKELCPQYLTK